VPLFTVSRRSAGRLSHAFGAEMLYAHSPNLSRERAERAFRCWWSIEVPDTQYGVPEICMSPFYITRPNTTQPMMLSQGPNSAHPPLDSNPSKGDIFPLNIAKSKTQNRPKSYSTSVIIWRMPPTNSYKTVQSHNNSHNYSPARSPQRTISMASTLEAANPTQPMVGPNPCPSLWCPRQRKWEGSMPPVSIYSVIDFHDSQNRVLLLKRYM